MPYCAKMLRAAQLAVEYHNGQTRKVSEVPYVVHPLRVAKVVADLQLPTGVNRDHAILAAILHDMLEDTKVEPEVIAREFGPEVYKIVTELTLDLGLPRAARIEKMLRRTEKMSPAAKIVKLADRLDNMRDMDGRDKRFIKRYCGEAQAILEKLRGACPVLEAEIEKIIEKHGKLEAAVK